MQLSVVGDYQRTLGASLERLLENALDWEHLPWIHSSSFNSIECHDQGPWGWRATIGSVPAQAPFSMELLLDRDTATWVSRTTDGVGAGTEIWSRAAPTGPESCTVAVEFHLPDIRPEKAQRLGAHYRELYRRLYDEDESMMVVRQAALTARDRVPVRVVEVDGEQVAFKARCPHMLGPLEEAPIVDCVIQCPWHGYRFDVRSGRNLDGRACRLTRVTQSTNEVAGPKGP